MRFILPPTVALAAMLLAVPAFAAQKADPPTEPEKPMNDRDVSAADVASTPLTDFNLKKGQIPKLLIDAQDRPYDITGLRSCAQIAAAVGELDAVLGEDIDTANARDGGLKAGQVAQAAVRVFIPFSGLIREVSGANGQERKVQAAVYAGSVRRAFLKGVGQQRGCRYPARAATHKDVMAMQAVRTGEPVAAQPAKKAARKKRRR